jgi:enamine deaminase RidA (YjgF/YER057c/UK114 family)
MRKSEIISAQFERIMQHLDMAQGLIGKLPTEYVDQSIAVNLFNKIDRLMAEMDDFHMDTVAPIQSEEDDRDNEIEELEARLAELRSQR